MCAPDIVKNLNVKVFNLVLGTNETRCIEWHETCKCKCRFNCSVCDNKECNVGMTVNVAVNAKNWLIMAYGIKDLFGVLVIVSVNVINLTEYLDYKNCRCNKMLVNKLVEECTENIEETRLVKINSTKCNSVENKCKHNSCTLYIMLFSLLFTIDIGIGMCFLYFHWYLKKWCSSC